MAVLYGTRKTAGRLNVSVPPTLYPHKKDGQSRKPVSILQTTNGGTVWERQTSGTQQDLLGVFFVDEKTGWCVGSGGEIIHTDNGGKTWTAAAEWNELEPL